MNTHKSPSHHRQLDRLIAHRIKTHRHYKSIKGVLTFKFTVRKVRHLKNAETIDYAVSFMGKNTALLYSDKGLIKLINDLMNRSWPCTSGIVDSFSQIDLSNAPKAIDSDDYLTQYNIRHEIAVSTLKAVGEHRPRDSDLFK